jgi:hypothetical protein
MLAPDLVTRILYRLRFASEQLPLDSVSLAYVLPLIVLVLSQNGIEEQKGDEEGEQVLLSLEFLSFHSSSCECPTIPLVIVDLNGLLLQFRMDVYPAGKFCST